MSRWDDRTIFGSARADQLFGLFLVVFVFTLAGLLALAQIARYGGI